MATKSTNQDGSSRSRTDQLPRQVFGLNTKSQNDETRTEMAVESFPASRLLNPAFSRWLMGFPEEWDNASPSFREFQQVQHGLLAAIEGPA